MANSHIMALLGGSFDPVHNAHLHCAKAIVDTLSLDRLWLLPNHHSANKYPELAPEIRLHLLNLAIECESKLNVLEYEINQPTTSYTTNTLSQIKQQHPDKTLIFIIGSDSLNTIDQWHQWQKILEYGHLIVVQRPGAGALDNPTIQQWVTQHTTSAVAKLLQHTKGFIFPMDINAPNIASSTIRACCKTPSSRNEDLYNMLPPRVATHILKHQLYQ